MVHIYRREEGMWARMPFAIVGGIMTVALSSVAMSWVTGVASYIWGGLVFALCGAVTVYFAFFHIKTGEVLIDTESEMRKVVWPTREEVTGSTIVVIATSFLLAILLFIMDVIIVDGMKLVHLY